MFPGILVPKKYGLVHCMVIQWRMLMRDVITSMVIRAHKQSITLLQFIASPNIGAI